MVMVRLELYNRGLPCGPKALHGRLDVHEHLRPLPSERTIARMLARNGLTYGRTGWYEGEDPEWLPASAKRWRPKNRGGMNMGRVQLAVHRAAESLAFPQSHEKRLKPVASAQNHAEVVGRALSCSDTSIGPEIWHSTRQ